MPVKAKTQDSQALQKRLQQALLKQGIAYKPRTEWLLPDGRPKYTNRLILENSPYLIQHAHNPVNWYAWGDEAFAKAKADNKPIFLSIGYSTCHWCHVMERESFDNEVVANYLNQNFISIKVDREQRPDIDSYYMTGVMLLTGSGGWPMSNFLMPDGRPFYGGTYFPADSLINLLQRINLVWKTRHDEIEASAKTLTTEIAKITSSKSSATKIDRQLIDNAVNTIVSGYDEHKGGFSPAPKFPNEPSLFLLLRQMQKGSNVSVTKAIKGTLNGMAQGGIYDQVGGGFHRYSTDREWLVPHFEKMLYNQGHLSRVYLQAYQLTGDTHYKRVATQTLDYLLKEMNAPNGGFYSATDADSEGKEGLFFVWKEDEIKSILPAELASLAIDLYSVSKTGNFEGQNILNLPLALNEYATLHKMPLSELFTQVDKIRKLLWQSREKKRHPLRDDKIVTAWNGMVIGALAEAGAILNQSDYLQQAKQTADFLWQNNRMDSGRLFRAYLNGTASVAAVQEDYAYFAEALIRLYDVTADPSWLKKSIAITEIMLEDFWDKKQGGFFMANQSKIATQMHRLKEVHDGAIPSGNSVAVRVLAELYMRTGKQLYMDRALATMAAFSDQISVNPAAYAYLLLGVDQILDGERGSVQYAARSAVSVHANLVAKRDNNFSLTIDLKIKPGWHINAHKPLQKDLIATEISLNDNAKGWQLDSINYPQPLQKKMAFQSSVLALYEGNVQVLAEIKKDSSNYSQLPIEIILQACNDKHCLAPEKLQMNVLPF